MHPLRRLMPFLRPYRSQFIFGTVALLIPFPLVAPLVWMYVVDKVIIARKMGMLVPALLVMFGVQALGNAVTALRSYVLGNAGERVIFDLRNACYQKLQRQGLGYFHRRRSGDLISRTMNDVEAVRDAIVSGIDEIFSSIVSFIYVAAIIVYLQPVVGAVTLVPLAIVGLLVYRFNGQVKALYRSIRDRLGDVTANLQESFAGMMVIKAFGRDAYEVRRFERTSRTYLDDSLRGVRVRSTYMPSVMTVGFLSNVAMLGLGAVFVLRGQFTLGGLTAYRAYWWQLFSPIMSIARINEVWQRAVAASSRVIEVLDAPEDIVDAADAVTPDRVKGEIALHGVSFAYDPGKPVLRDVSLHIAPGHSIGVVGPSGAGKSTLLALLLRLYEAQHGRVAIDGHDVREIVQTSLRSQFGIVTQEAFLFNESIRENIRYGRMGATDAEVEEAARLANAHDFIVSLAHGYDSVAGERGVKLSGGQRQRICIARAFLANPAILLLDEATAAVEPESELIIQNALTRLMQGRTTIIVSHRLSMVRDTDRIVVIREGRIAEHGRHRELLETDGWYARMYRLQMGEEEPARNQELVEA